jgi:catechol 2,3-dioxygenase-like lactoylglutathione lyase family enzyme
MATPAVSSSAPVTGPVKRVSIWVRDAERSLACYRDALGLDVIEDKRVAGAAIGRMVGLESASLRIVHLAPVGATHGWVGLYEISDAVPTPTPELPRPSTFPMYGQATVVLTTSAMAQIVSKLRACAGVRFITEPTEYVKTTSGDATPPGRYSEAIFFDPDGVPVSLLGYSPS